MHKCCDTFNLIVEERRKREKERENAISRKIYIHEYPSVREWDHFDTSRRPVRKHQVDRSVQRTKYAYNNNRESTNWLARLRRDLSFERENATLFFRVT